MKIIGRSWLIHNATSVYTQVPKGYGATCLLHDISRRHTCKQRRRIAPRVHASAVTWLITCCEAELRDYHNSAVRNAGVVGCTPILGPGDFFEYHRYMPPSSVALTVYLWLASSVHAQGFDDFTPPKIAAAPTWTLRKEPWREASRWSS